MVDKSSIVPAATVAAGALGAITFTDVYQAMSFLVLILSAVHLVLKIRRVRQLPPDED